MFGFAAEIVAQAELEAEEEGATLTSVLPLLRKLGLDDFGLLLISMPNPRWPHLSSILPRMANKKVQERYTGRSGVELYKQTSVFVRQIESSYVRQSREGIQGKRMLDFGCGYGRLIRMMYYFTEPSKIFAVDSEDTPRKICREDGVQAQFQKSANLPTSLAASDSSIDVAYAYSVFTHLPGSAAEACLDAVKKTLRPGGLFVITMAPVELWANIGPDVNVEALTKQHHDQGIAHRPHEVHQHYGWTTMKFDFLRDCGWNLLHYDSSLDSPLQITVTLQRP